jgi:hypothetical protein
MNSPEIKTIITSHYKLQRDETWMITVEIKYSSTTDGKDWKDFSGSCTVYNKDPEQGYVEAIRSIFQEILKEEPDENSQVL